MFLQQAGRFVDGCGKSMRLLTCLVLVCCMLIKMMSLTHGAYHEGKVFADQISIAACGGDANGYDMPATLAGVNPLQMLYFNSSLYILETDRISMIDENGYIHKILGAGTGSVAVDGPASEALLNAPYGLAIDPTNGDIYYAECHRIRKVSNNYVTTIAGSGMSSSYRDDEGVFANVSRLSGPHGIVIDSSGNIIFADSEHQRIRKISAIDGRVYTVAGTGNQDISPDNSNATTSPLYYPTALAINSAGEIVFVEALYLVRKIRLDGTLVTVAGSIQGNSFRGDGMNALRVIFKQIGRIFIDSNDDLYVVEESDWTIHRINNATQVCEKFAGATSSSKTVDGYLATQTYLPGITHVVRAFNDSLVIGHRSSLANSYDASKIRMLDSNNYITSTLVGTLFPGNGQLSKKVICWIGNSATPFYRNDGTILFNYYYNSGVNYFGKVSSDGILSFYSIKGLITQYAYGLIGDDIYYAYDGNTIKKYSVDGVESFVAGAKNSAGNTGVGGPLRNALLSSPNSIALNSIGEMFIADKGNYRVLRVFTNGTVEVFAGTGVYGTTPFTNGDLATSINFTTLVDVRVNQDNNVIISDTNRVMMINSTDGTVSLLTSMTNTGRLAIGERGIIYITLSNYIIKFNTTDKTYTTVVGADSGTCLTSSDGTNALQVRICSVEGPYYVNGVLYFFESNRLRKLVNGKVYLVAGGGLYSQDNVGPNESTLSTPNTVYVDPVTNDIFIGEAAVVRKISNGKMKIIMGGGAGYSAIGPQPTSISVNVVKSFVPDPNNNNTLIFCDSSNHRIRYLSKDASSSSIIGGGLGGDTLDSASFVIGDFIIVRDEIYFYDSFNYVIRKLNSTHIVSLAGNGQYSGNTGDGGLAMDASIRVNALAVAPNGEIYFSDGYGYVIRKVGLDGIISTIAGVKDQYGYSGDGGKAVNAKVKLVSGISVNSRNEVYFVDTFYPDTRLRRINRSGYIFTVSGGPSAKLSTGAAASVTMAGATRVTHTSDFEMMIASRYSFQLLNSSFVCAEGYYGDDCQYYSCYNVSHDDPTACSSLGVCETPDNCTCVDGHYGTGDYACVLYDCYGVAMINSSVCSSHGECLSPNNCSCAEPYHGKNCEQYECYGINLYNASVCSGHGSCSDVETCTCKEGYSDFDCSYFECFGIDFKNSTVCSGFGSCLSPNNCSCKTGYYGADCSQHDCYSINYQNETVCSTHGQCIYPNNCTCEEGYYSKDCSLHDCYGILFNKTGVCSNLGSCISPNNCSCNEGYYGADCSKYDCFGTNSLSDGVCSSHGTCNATNSCVCESGYYGNNCSQHDCYGINSISSLVCSGKGTCSTPNHCNCNNGYFDTDCSKFLCFGILPSLPTACSSRGNCTDYNTCVCEPGYLDKQCESYLCYGMDMRFPAVCSQHGSCVSPNNCSCKTGYYSDDCSKYDCFGISSSNSSSCSSHGKCIAYDTCKCDNGYYDSDCSKFDCYHISSLNESTCSSHGKCLSPNSCSCTPPYYGAECSQFDCFDINYQNTSVCNSKGSCISPNNCSCSVTGYYGEECSKFDCFGIYSQNSSSCSSHGKCIAYDTCKCDNGYYDSDCSKHDCFGISSLNETVCSSHGKCLSPNECSCATSYYGAECSQFNCYDINYQNTSVCPSVGQCLSPNNCSCNEGYYSSDCSKHDCFGIVFSNSATCSSNGHCILPNNCTCEEGYYDSDCSKFDCFGISSLNASVCSSTGECSTPNNCSCSQGFYGIDCDLFKCYGISSLSNSACSSNGQCINPNNCSCNTGYYGEECSKFDCFGISSLISQTCSSHGQCVSFNNCTCNTGYYDSDCSKHDCFGICSLNETVCSSHGKCLSPNECSCTTPYYGAECSQFDCFGINYQNTSVCSSKGSCVSINNCSCLDGYFGDNCEKRMCYDILFTDSNVCSSHGKCISPNNCSCDIHYYGDHCSDFDCYGVNYQSSLVCSSMGRCLSPNNCSCPEGYYGSDCSKFDCFSVNSLNSAVCSAHGQCNSPNNCSCSEGFYDDDCSKFDCFGISSLLKDACSTFGKCKSPNNCSCDNGYYGNSCSKFDCFGIPSTNSTVCSSSGSCNSPNNCSCNPGFYGPDCSLFDCFGTRFNEKTTCSARGQCVSPNSCSCDKGYYSDDCSKFDCYGISSLNSTIVCSSHGQCTSANNCSCSKGYYGQDCAEFDCFGVSSLSSNVCSTNGTCTAPDTCKCNKANKGDNCQFVKPPIECYSLYFDEPNVCSSHGLCLSNDNCTCFSGYRGIECNDWSCFGKDVSDPNTCSMQGKCVSPDKCQCNPGYDGIHCELVQCFDKLSNDSQICSSHGKCTKPNTCTCNSGFGGENCQYYTCFGKLSNETSVCNGNGVCSNSDSCQCHVKSNVKISGSMCQTVACLGGLKGNYYLQSDKNVCSGKGTCSAESGCKCSAGYYGDACQYYTCNGIASNETNVCSGKGQCTEYNKCVCNQGVSTGFWTGVDCEKCLPNYETEQSGCNTKKCDPVSTCNSHGICNSTLQCECSGNWEGIYCSSCKSNYFGLSCDKYCEKSKTCSNHGTCSSDGSCVCNSDSSLGYFQGASCDKCQNGFYGSECSTQLIGPVKFLNMFNGIKFTVFGPQSYSFNSVNCSRLVSDLSKLGKDPICSWSNKLNGDFQVLFGTDFTLTIGDTINIDRNVFETNSASRDLVSFSVLNADLPVTPTLVMIGKNIVSPCELISIDASGSYSGDRKSLIYKWNVISSPITLPNIVNLNSPKLEVNTTYPGDYVFSLSATSSISGQSSQTQQFTVSKLDTPLPTISILQIPTITANDIPLIIKKIISLPECYYSDQRMKIEWSQISGPSVETQIDSNNNLVIKQFLTKGEQTYSFQVKATSLFNSVSTSSTSITFKTEYSDLELVIYSIDVTKSAASIAIEFSDPDSTNEDSLWEWKCEDYTNSQECGLVISQILGSSTSSLTTLNLPSTDFQNPLINNPPLKVTLSVTKGNRKVSSFMEFTFPNNEISPPTICLINYSPTTAKVVKSDIYSLNLDVTVDGVKSGYESHITRQWKINDQVLTLQNPILNRMSELVNSLVIDTSSLDEGSTYEVKLEITDNRILKSATFSQKFTIAISPQPCRCSLSPASGYALDTSFTYSCVNCQNEQKSLQLSYGFLDEKSKTKIYLYTGTSSFATKLPLIKQAFVKIIDTSSGASTQVPVSISITAPVVASLTEVKKKSNTWTTYAKSLKDGDPIRNVFNTYTILETVTVMMNSVTSRRRIRSQLDACSNGGTFDPIENKCNCPEGYAKSDCSLKLEPFNDIKSLRQTLMNDTQALFDERNPDEAVSGEFLIFEMMVIDALLAEFDEIDDYILSNSLNILQQVITFGQSNKYLKVATNYDNLLVSIIHSIKNYIVYFKPQFNPDIEKLLKDATILLIRRKLVGEKDLYLETDYSLIISNKVYRNMFESLTITDQSNYIILPKEMPNYVTEKSNRKALSFYMSTSSSPIELVTNDQFLSDSSTVKNETFVKIVKSSRSKMTGFFGIDVVFENIIVPMEYKLKLSSSFNISNQIPIVNITSIETENSTITTSNSESSVFYCASDNLIRDETCSLVFNGDFASCSCTNQRMYVLVEERTTRREIIDKVLEINVEQSVIPETSKSETQISAKSSGYLAAFIVPFVLLFVLLSFTVILSIVMIIKKNKKKQEQMNHEKQAETNIEMASV